MIFFNPLRTQSFTNYFFVFFVHLVDYLYGILRILGKQDGYKITCDPTLG